jgi:hypothetical protein
LHSADQAFVPVLFPVVTDGNEEIVATYRLFAPGEAHGLRRRAASAFADYRSPMTFS